MNYALYAVGPDGQFGLNGKLPWGSIPEELEHFYTTAKKSDAIVVGAKTYFYAPKKLKDFLVTKQVYVYGAPDGELLSSKHQFITQITPAFRKLSKNYAVTFIGGKVLLEKALEANILDVLIVTEVKPNCVTQHMPADVYLNRKLIEHPISATIVHGLYGKTEEFNYRVRKVYL